MNTIERQAFAADAVAVTLDEYHLDELNRVEYVNGTAVIRVWMDIDDGGDKGINEHVFELRVTEVRS